MMDFREVRFTYKTYPDRQSMNESDALLITDAEAAIQYAYAPYSKFKVGVAIRTIEGLVTTGSNQENSSFPVGQCAERVALYRLVHEHGRPVIEAIAIVVDHDSQKTPASPCGACRQIIMEYRSLQEQPIRLFLGLKNSGEVYEFSDVSDLLPLAFEGSFLGI
jgi:cytidine deaminase